MPNEPTLGEQVRRLDAVTSRLDRTVDRMDSEFVRKETYAAERHADKAEVAEARKDIDEIKNERSDNQKWRRTASLTLAVAAVGWLVTIVVALVAALR